MKIQLSNIGKKFRKHWIFRQLDFTLEEGQKLVVLGPNGSGKSTLLQVFSGLVIPNEGNIQYWIESKEIEVERVYKHISVAAPYQDLFETFTLKEMFEMHSKFKSLHVNEPDEFFEILHLSAHRDKVISEFSSGMKQRLKLGLAIMSKTDLLLLDEPLINLDEMGKEIYFKLISDFGTNRNIIVCSNHHKDEYHFCDSELNVADFNSSLNS